MSGSTQKPASVPWVFSASQLPSTAPMTYCPSAPIFQRLARKQYERPMAMSASGVALTMSSCRAHGSLRG